MCDFADLAKEIARLEQAQARALHLDCMDGHFVPNFTYGLTIVEACRRRTYLPLDVHLMIENPEHWVERFAEAGADLITVHVEATRQPRALLEQIRGLGVGAGIALNPGTPVSELETCLDVCDAVLVMSVEPGFGGQKFNPNALEKLRELKARLAPNVLLSIDGGINDSTIAASVQRGAQELVVGSAIFQHDDYAVRIRELEGLGASPPKAME